ncbi:hypothetical protein CDD83_7475 [Cordyceps sp. RAO-2017]|nr:hypothetical protein CDD83_7475 [Cordyceps sp. RAO-2017]
MLRSTRLSVRMEEDGVHEWMGFRARTGGPGGSTGSASAAVPRTMASGTRRRGAGVDAGIERTASCKGESQLAASLTTDMPMPRRSQLLRGRGLTRSASGARKLPVPCIQWFTAARSPCGPGGCPAPSTEPAASMCPKKAAATVRLRPCAVPPTSRRFAHQDGRGGATWSGDPRPPRQPLSASSLATAASPTESFFFFASSSPWLQRLD